MSAEARAVGRDLPISFKFACELCSHIRGKPVARAQRDLAAAISLARPIPFIRFAKDLAHKPGKVAGARYPVKASRAVLSLLNSAVANAVAAGMDADALVVSYAVSNTGTGRWHFGRHRRRRMKRAHVEIRVQPQGVVAS